mgnify:CR=1 FL=1
MLDSKGEATGESGGGAPYQDRSKVEPGKFEPDLNDEIPFLSCDGLV